MSEFTEAENTLKMLVNEMLDTKDFNFTKAEFLRALSSDVAFYDEHALSELRLLIEKRLTFYRSVDNAQAVKDMEELLSAIIEFRDSEFYRATGIEL